jgi:hypothetical protein
MVRFVYAHHPRMRQRDRVEPVKTADVHPVNSPAARFNTRLAVLITQVVGSMWCAYAFAAFDLISLPAAIQAGTAAIVAWIAQTFLQLVLLSIIMVGQNVSAAAADKRQEQTFQDAEMTLHEIGQMQQHLSMLETQLMWMSSALQGIAEHSGAVLPPKTGS